MCIRDSYVDLRNKVYKNSDGGFYASVRLKASDKLGGTVKAVSYTHLRAHETVLDLVCRLLLEKKKNNNITQSR